jgi:hypothetical protein
MTIKYHFKSGCGKSRIFGCVYRGEWLYYAEKTINIAGGMAGLANVFMWCIMVM